MYTGTFSDTKKHRNTLPQPDNLNNTTTATDKHNNKNSRNRADRRIVKQYKAFKHSLPLLKDLSEKRALSARNVRELGEGGGGEECFVFSIIFYVLCVVVLVCCCVCMLCVFMCFIVELCCFGLFSCMYGVSV